MVKFLASGKGLVLRDGHCMVRRAGSPFRWWYRRALSCLILAVE